MHVARQTILNSAIWLVRKRSVSQSVSHDFSPRWRSSGDKKQEDVTRTVSATSGESAARVQKKLSTGSINDRRPHRGDDSKAVEFLGVSRDPSVQHTRAGDESAPGGSSRRSLRRRWCRVAGPPRHLSAAHAERADYSWTRTERRGFRICIGCGGGLCFRVEASSGAGRHGDEGVVGEDRRLC